MREQTLASPYGKKKRALPTLTTRVFFPWSFTAYDFRVKERFVSWYDSVESLGGYQKTLFWTHRTFSPTQITPLFIPSPSQTLTQALVSPSHDVCHPWTSRDYRQSGRCHVRMSTCKKTQREKTLSITERLHSRTTYDRSVGIGRPAVSLSLCEKARHCMNRASPAPIYVFSRTNGLSPRIRDGREKRSRN
ncbi:hypothetical protein BDY19DRAFT_85430 [Irpex rosettiformis]|uniref:Uncharacterized protein n=1 Tax=Irpex rosettiformis TaxID=378272 RepID=A0ACB8U6A2_9APHY|nr:hypothetical protein BDY19DRAFT_85430 [Irpex rosettiformis]